jgi:hypothetical protein
MKIATSKLNAALVKDCIMNKPVLPADACCIEKGNRRHEPSRSKNGRARGSVWLCLIAIAVLLPAVPAHAGLILYDTLGANAGAYQDGYAWTGQSPNNLGESFLSGSSAAYLTSVTLLLGGGNGSDVDLYLYANTGSNNADFTDGPLDDLGTVNPGNASAFYTLNFTDQVSLAANTEYWIVGGGTAGGWNATFLTVPYIEANSVGTANQFVEQYGTAKTIYPENSNEVFEMEVTDSEPSSTPEPSTWGMLALGATVIVAKRKSLQRIMKGSGCQAR